jgi:hypothetical protein
VAGAQAAKTMLKVISRLTTKNNFFNIFLLRTYSLIG